MNKSIVMGAASIGYGMAALLVMKMITKSDCKFDAKNLLVFAGAAIIGGYFTAKQIAKIEAGQ